MRGSYGAARKNAKVPRAFLREPLRGLAQNIPPKMPSDIFGGLRWIPYCSDLDTVKRPVTVDLDKDQKMQNGFAKAALKYARGYFLTVLRNSREREVLIVNTR